MRNIICITTYPPRECGIATFAQDLIRAILSKFGDSYSIKICAVESDTEKHTYTEDVEYVLNTSDVSAYAALTKQLNENSEVKIVLVQLPKCGKNDGCLCKSGSDDAKLPEYSSSGLSSGGR